jgi:hypothetical protein
MAEQIAYRNLWYGLTLEHPTGWQVRQAPGCIMVSPGAASVTCAAVRFFAMDAGRQEQHVMPTLRGDQIMVNPTDGTRYEVPLSYGAYWTDAAQRVYRTPSPGAPPVPGADRLEPI